MRVVGSTGDITAEKTFARERYEARIRLFVALESISQGFALFDAGNRLVINSRHREFFAQGAGLKGRTHWLYRPTLQA